MSEHQRTSDFPEELSEELSNGDRRALAAWRAPAPPPGVVSAAMAREAKERWRRRLVGGAAAAVVLIGIGIGLGWPVFSPGELSGQRVARGRVTETVGDRATLVLESGAEVEWRVTANGNATVQQARGDVFYRVEPGGAFAIHTPAGQVRVRGTCLRVEVDEMKPRNAGLLGAVAGSALAAAAVITVYEGSVVAASAGVERLVPAGEVVEVSPGAPPVAMVARRGSVTPRPPVEAVAADDDNRVSYDTYARLYEQTEELRGKVAELESELYVEKTMRREKEGTRIEAPDSLPAKFEKDALLEAFRNAIATTGVPMEVSAIDCTEYPCIVVGNLRGDPQTSTFDDSFSFLRRFLDGPGFEAYRNDTSNRVSVWRQAAGEDGTRERTLFAVSMYPESDGDARGEQLKQRLRYRSREILEASRPAEE